MRGDFQWWAKFEPSRCFLESLGWFGSLSESTLTAMFLLEHVLGLPAVSVFGTRSISMLADSDQYKMAKQLKE